MNITQRLQEMARSASARPGDEREEWRGDGWPTDRGYPGGYGPPNRSGLWGGLLGRSLEVVEVQEEVAVEQEGRLAIVGPDEQLNRLLLARLRGQQPIPLGAGIRREGFFTLATIPAGEESNEFVGRTGSPTEESNEFVGRTGSPTEESNEFVGRTASPTYEWAAFSPEMTDALADHDILVYLFSAQMGWQPADAHCYARLRGAHLPILPVAVLPGAEATAGWSQSDFGEEVRQRLGVRPVFIDLAHPDEWDGDAGDDSLLLLVQRILALRPRLAVPLAQEVPGCRVMIAQRVIRTGALMTLLLGSEPIPLLDLPLHVATQWKVALQLAAIYGRPGLDYRSREMAGTVAVNLLVRHLAQQLLKLVPLVGGLLSGLLSGLSTWLLGQALVRHYQEQQVIPLPAWQPDVWVEQLAHRRTQMARIFTDRMGKVRRKGFKRGQYAAAEAQEVKIWVNGHGPEDA